MTSHSTFDPNRTEKTCSTCRRLLAIGEFNRDRSKPDGHSTYCRACHKVSGQRYASTAEWRARRRLNQCRLVAAARALLNELKSQPCTDCRGVFPPYVMHYDHRDPSMKRLNVAGWKSAGAIPQMLAEIEKCDLVCANCHAIRTHHQWQDGVFDGKHRPRKAE